MWKNIKYFYSKFQIRFIVCKGITIITAVWICVLLVLSAGAVIYYRNIQTDATKLPAKLAIIIDDFGRQRRGVKEMLELDCKLTVAVMPFLEYSEEDAQKAVESGKEVILHLPMQATLHDNWTYVGPQPFKINQSREEIVSLLGKMIENIPQACGANIHMGTVSSTKENIMRPIFETLKEKNMYFVDSKTSSKSICKKIAEETQISFYENEVFLEHEQKTKAYVKKRLTKAMKIAIDKGQCIAIGHVGIEGGMITVQAIKEMQDTFEKNNVQLVWVSDLVSEPFLK